MNTGRAAETRVYTLADLCGMFGFTARQMHDLRAKGALQPPQGVGRGARYTDEHVQRLVAIKPLLEDGVSVAKVAKRYQSDMRAAAHEQLAAYPVAEQWTRVRISADMELMIRVSGRLERHESQITSRLSKEALAAIGQFSASK